MKVGDSDTQVNELGPSGPSCLIISVVSEFLTAVCIKYTDIFTCLNGTKKYLNFWADLKNQK